MFNLWRKQLVLEVAGLESDRVDQPAHGLGFRDVSNAVFPPNWSSGPGKYEQVFGDLDQDDHLDIYGMNWADVGVMAAISVGLYAIGWYMYMKRDLPG